MKGTSHVLQFAADISTNVPEDPLVSPGVAVFLFCVIFLLSLISLIIDNLGGTTSEIGEPRMMTTDARELNSA